MSRPLRIGARTSPLATVQADAVAALLSAQGIESVLVGVTTTGDVDRRALTEIGGTGVFAGAVRDALRHAEIDLAVHSLKDLPTAAEPDLEVAAIPAREDTRDVLIGRTLDELEDGARIGTGSPRRAAQLLDHAERVGLTLEVVPIRGNVDTRIAKVRSGEVDAVVLAAAGLLRLGRLASAAVSDPGAPDDDGPTAGPAAMITEVSGLRAQILPFDVMLPAPGQGALALEVSRGLAAGARAAVQSLDDATARAESLAERGFLAALEAGCTAPVGARVRVGGVRGTSLDLTLDAVIGRTLLSNLSEPANAGQTLRRKLSGTVTDPGQFGVTAGRRLLEELHDPQRSRR